ncbi:MAG: hypothetical protein LBJ71_03730 [Holosporaceae bacterium]|jgi:hypothetical protein|nr:hypothetical protein [Holosporaceae bacterium]
MRNFMFTLSVLAVCSVGAMDEGSFGKVIEDFKNNSYENAVSTAINLIEDPSSKFQNDSKVFLHEFFDCMLSEEPKLGQFRERVSKLCSDEECLEGDVEFSFDDIAQDSDNDDIEELGTELSMSEIIKEAKARFPAFSS